MPPATTHRSFPAAGETPRPTGTFPGRGYSPDTLASGIHRPPGPRRRTDATSASCLGSGLRTVPVGRSMPHETRAKSPRPRPRNRVPAYRRNGGTGPLWSIRSLPRFGSGCRPGSRTGRTPGMPPGGFAGGPFRSKVGYSYPNNTDRLVCFQGLRFTFVGTGLVALYHLRMKRSSRCAEDEFITETLTLGREASTPLLGAAFGDFLDALHAVFPAGGHAVEVFFRDESHRAVDEGQASAVPFGLQ